MAENISGINYTTTTNSITSSSGNSKGTKPEVDEEKKDTTPAPAEQKTQYSAEEVFAMMQAQGVMNMSQLQGASGINPYDYLSAEDIARIEAAMTDFEAAVAQGLIDIDNEFGDILSDEAKLALAGALAGE